MIVMHRTCPACHEKLTTNDHYFCGNCGSILDASLVQKIDSSQKIIDLNKVPFKKEQHPKKPLTDKAKEVVQITNAKGIVALLLVLGFIGFPIYFFLSGLNSDLIYLVRSVKPQPKFTLLTETTGSRSKDIKQTTSSAASTGLLSTALGNPQVISFVPYNIDIYLESGDIHNSLKMLAVNDNYYAQLQEAISPNVKSPYAVYIQDRTEGLLWMLIVPMKEGKTFTLPDKYKWLTAKIVDNTLLLSNNASLISLSEDVKAGLEKNINMNPSFVPLRTKLNTTGKMEILAVTSIGRNILSSSQIAEIPVELKNVVMPYFKNPNNYLVIN